MLSKDTVSKYRQQGLTSLEILELASDNDQQLRQRVETHIVRNAGLEDWEREKAAEYYLAKHFGKPSAVSASMREAASMIKSNPFNPFTQPPRSIEQNLQQFLPKEGSLLDYATAPARAAVGAGVKGLGALTGVDVSQNEDVQALPDNLKKSAATARVVVPAAVGLATGGLGAIPSMAVSGAAGAGSSLLASGLEQASGDDQTASGVAGEAVGTGLATAAIDGATRGLFSLAKPLLKAKGVAELSKKAQNLAGQVTQQTQNLDDAVKAVRELGDVSSIQTHDDLFKAASARVKSLSAAQDEVFAGVTEVKPMSKFEEVFTSGTAKVKANPVTDAFDGLEELYTKTGNHQKLAEITQLRAIAKYRGLQAGEVNQLARDFGIGWKSFSDKTGQPLTSLNAQKYENIRSAVKKAARGMMPNKASVKLDEELGRAIRIRDAARALGEAVQKAQNKLSQNPNLANAASKIGASVDVLLARAPSTFFRSILRGVPDTGRLGAIEIEKALPKNLKLIQDLSNKIATMSEGELVGVLRQWLGDAAEKTVNIGGKAAVGAVSNSLQE